ncbi:MAG: nucleoside triphosphate pyrophosphohydrolase, partial [Desulfomonilaceae bacterium]
MSECLNEIKTENCFYRMLELIKTLRSENGCPWDKKQTLETFHPYILEEYHELVHAIFQNDFDSIVDETGDLIFLVTFVAYMLEQSGISNVDDVIEGVIKKMTLRHPHVFGDVKVNNSQDVVDNWAKIKASEERIKERKSLLDGIPRSAPALSRAQKLSSRAAKVGFDWSGPNEVMAKVYEELDELKQTIEIGDNNRIKAEFGDVLFSIVNLGRHLSVNCESSLTSSSDKFENRFHFIEDKLKSDHKSIHDSTIEEMDKL